MVETYTQGTWSVKPGEEDAFVAEFRESIMRVRAHCDDFQPAVFELVTSVE